MIRQVTAGVALAFVILLHVWSAAALIARAPFLDEVESLQAGVKMARGERPYKDFAEHHPPFVFALLATFAPTKPTDDIRTYVVRARILFAIFGGIALAAASSIVWMASKRMSAAILFLALLLVDPGLWLRAFADVHAEAPALALWWLGAALVVISLADRRGTAILLGLGIGLIANACLWNPKWPVTSGAIGIVFLTRIALYWRRRRADAITAAGIAIAAVGVGLALLAALADFRDVAGHVFGLSLALAKWSNRLQAMHVNVTGAGPTIPWVYCPPMFRPRYILPATAVIVVAMFRAPRALHNRAVTAIFLALIGTALIEIRFFYPYPMPWVQYYILWSMAAAAILALVPQSIVALLSLVGSTAGRVSVLIPIVATVVALVAAVMMTPRSPEQTDPYWRSAAYLRSRLNPSDRVWIELARYPIGARDDNYYWFGFDTFVPVALQYARTPEGSRVLPPIGEEDLPPCRLERGLEPNLRFIAAAAQYRRLPAAAACFERLRMRGVVLSTPVPNVYLIAGR
jgi:hypothetical protein